MAGGKIMALTLPEENIRFVDSLNFLQMPLAEFPKMFDIRLEGEDDLCAKGYFCHLFHTKANMEADYHGPMPPHDTYDPDSMSTEKCKAFNVWYDQQVARGHEFHLKTELIKYCLVDVSILRLEVIIFCQQFQAMNGINPIKHSVTLASICNSVYHAQHMPKDTMPYIPVNGYRPKVRYSWKAMQWLSLLNKRPEYDGRIQHAMNQGEYFPQDANVGHVDGYDKQTRTVMTFLGCYWHSCLKCNDPDTISPQGIHTHQWSKNITYQRWWQMGQYQREFLFNSNNEIWLRSRQMEMVGGTT